VKNRILIHQGKLLSRVIKSANLGNGSTWPGHLALQFNKNFIKDILKNSKTIVIFVIGTNGKTTTTSLIAHILQQAGKKVIQNSSGANLLNGIASTLLLNTSESEQIAADYIIFEIDESTFPLACQEITPDVIIMLNLFRDQLDRYGEINTIALKWQEALAALPKDTQLILNADDPQIAYLGKKSPLNELYFGVDEKGRKTPLIDHASDSTYCPNCGEKLKYTKKYYSHLGVWSCPSCQLVRPTHVKTSSFFYPLDGMYNRYNTNAATLLCSSLGVPDEIVKNSLGSFKPVFGRQEKITFEGKNIEIILAKNPAGMDQSIEAIMEKNASNLLLLLNDRIADGHDVSWIWDIDIENLLTLPKITLSLSGDRAYDLALRFKYAEADLSTLTISDDLVTAIKGAVLATPQNETLYILATYTAMLDARKILTGKKIL